MFLFVIFISLLNSKIVTVLKNMVLIQSSTISQSTMLDKSASFHRKIIVSVRRLHKKLLEIDTTVQIQI